MRSFSRCIGVAICAATASVAVSAYAAPSPQATHKWAIKHAPPFHTAVTLFVGDDLTLKHRTEDHLAADLESQGIAATPAYRILGDKVTTISAARDQLAQKGYDGLITMEVLGPTLTLDSQPRGYWGYGWYGTRDYVFTDTQHSLATAAWDLRNNTRVWSTTNRSTATGSAREISRQTSNAVAIRLLPTPPTEG